MELAITVGEVSEHEKALLKQKEELIEINKEVEAQKKKVKIEDGETVASTYERLKEKAEEALSAANDKGDKEGIAKYALMIREVNRDRSELREEINRRLEGKGRGTNKLGYLTLGRDK